MRKRAIEGLVVHPLEPLAALVKDFIARGGRLWACTPCVKARGYEQADLIDGVEITGSSKMHELIKGGLRPSASDLQDRTAMSSIDRSRHWENVYATKGEKDVSWFEETPAISLSLIRSTGVTLRAAVVDIGGGASRLVDALVNDGFEIVTVLDISEKALAIAKARLGVLGAKVRWVVADVTKWVPSDTYDVWHDRAAFHFLTDPADRVAYAERVRQAVRSGGHVIIGTFAPDGPERCSGLQIVRHDAASLGQMLGLEFEFMEMRHHSHWTPAGGVQSFQFSRFQRAIRHCLGSVSSH